MISRVAQETPHGCGQACVAMLLGLPFHAAVALVGHDRGTSTADLARVLRLAYGCPDRLVLGHPTTDPALVKVRVPGVRDWHWCVYAGARILDPDHAAMAVALGGRITSHLPLVGHVARPVRRVGRPLLSLDSLYSDLRLSS